MSLKGSFTSKNILFKKNLAISTLEIAKFFFKRGVILAAVADIIQITVEKTGNEVNVY